MAATEAAEQFGKALLVEIEGRFEQGTEDPGYRILQAVTRKTRRDQGVVMRPDRTVVITYRIVTAFPARERPDAPTGEAIRLQQTRRHRFRVALRGNAGQESMARVGGNDAAWLLVAIERKDIASKLLIEKCGIEALLQIGCFCAPLPCRRTVAAGLRDVGHGPPGAIDIGLHLHERDRPFGQPSIGMRDCIVTVLPALVAQAILVSTAIFEEAVTIAIACIFDPCASCLEVGPQRFDAFPVARAAKILARKEDEQGGGIDAAVIMAKGNFAGIGHFIEPCFVEDFTRLRIGCRVICNCLQFGQPEQGPTSQGRIVPEHFQRGDEGIPPEQGAIPRNAGICRRTLRRLGGQRRHICDAARHHRIERGVGRDDRGTSDQRIAAPPAQGPVTFEICARGIFVLMVGKGDLGVENLPLARRKAHIETHLVVADEIRLRSETDSGPTLDIVEPGITIFDPIRGAAGLGMGSAPLALVAAHFEHVAKIRAQGQFDAETVRTLVEVSYRKPFERAAFVQKLDPPEMQDIIGYALAGSVGQAGIGQIDDQGVDPVIQRRSQKHGIGAADREAPERKLPRIAKVDPFGRGFGPDNVAVGIE